MRIPAWLYMVVLLGLAFLGFSVTKERKIKKALGKAKAAEKETANTNQHANRIKHKAEREKLELELKVERDRPVSDRVRDSYAEYERRKSEG